VWPDVLLIHGRALRYECHEVSEASLAITRLDECHIFCVAEGANWLGADGKYWAISPDGEVSFNSRGERMVQGWMRGAST
jgi:hypothetical protein